MTSTRFPLPALLHLYYMQKKNYEQLIDSLVDSSAKKPPIYPVARFSNLYSVCAHRATPCRMWLFDWWVTHFFPQVLPISSPQPYTTNVLTQAKMISHCEVVRNEMIAAGAVKTFFELVWDQSNGLMQTLCTALIHTLMKEPEAIRKASKCRAAETLLHVLDRNTSNEHWEQRAIVLSTCSRLLFNRSCGLAFIYGGLM